MAQRTGLKAIRMLAFKACRLITRYDPAIRAAFPSNIALHLALEAANAACSALVQEADSAIVLGD